MIQLLTNEILDLVNQEKLNLDHYYDNNQIGYFPEVDIDYPDELHDFHNDYPLAAEK